MTAQIQQFDPLVYKSTTRQQWENAAEAWHRWGPLLNKWLGPSTEEMLDMAKVKAGDHVLDVAAGAGEQTMTTAKRVGEHGYVLATDISPSILAFAAKNAHESGFSNVAARELDGESLAELPAGIFDVAISRVGLIYFPDQRKALNGMIHALKKGGRVAAMVYSTPENNAFFSKPVSIIRRRAKLPPLAKGHPGPFSLGDDGILENLFTDVGMTDVQVKTISAPVLLDTADECLRFEQESFGALHQMMSGLSASDQDETWEEIREALTQYENGNGFQGPCEILVAVGTKS